MFPQGVTKHCRHQLNCSIRHQIRIYLTNLIILLIVFITAHHVIVRNILYLLFSSHFAITLAILANFVTVVSSIEQYLKRKRKRREGLEQTLEGEAERDLLTGVVFDVGDVTGVLPP